DLKLIWFAGQRLFLRPASVNDRQQAGVAGRQHFDARIASAELLIAFLDSHPEVFLVPADGQCWVAVAFRWYVNIAADSRNHFHELSDSSYALGSLVVELLQVDSRPRFDSGQDADDFFLANLHGTTNRTFPRTAVGQCCLDQVFASQ